MEKTGRKTQKRHNSNELSKRASDILGLHNGESLALYKALSQMGNGPVKDALDALCSMIESAPVKPEYKFDVYEITKDGTKKPLFAVTACSRQEAKANALACIKGPMSEDALHLELKSAKLVAGLSWAVFENILGTTDLANQWDIRDFECIGTFPDKKSAEACESEDFGIRIVKAV